MLKLNFFSFITMLCISPIYTAESVSASSSPTKLTPLKQSSIFGYILIFPQFNSQNPTLRQKPQLWGKQNDVEGNLIFVF